MIDEDKQIFCIRGHMKSGTNWLCRLLNLHPEIFSSGEYHWESYLRTYLDNRKMFRNIDEIETESALIRHELQQMAYRTMLKLSDSTVTGESGSAAVKLIGDRTPTTIHPVVFRDAAYLCMVRDIRDIVVSKVFHFLNSPRVMANTNMAAEVAGLKPQFDKDPWFFHKHPAKLLSSERFVRATCRTWRQSIKSNQNTAKNIKSIRVSVLKYEDLHENLDSVLEDALRFIGANPALMPAIPRYLQPGHRDENPNKFNRKGQVGDWKNYMTGRAKKWINEECGNLMLELGYIDSFDWSFRDITKQAPPQRRAA